MEQLRQQVLRARRRLIAQQFSRIVGWWLFAALVVSAAAVAVPKIWVMGFNADESAVWVTSWLGGSAVVAFLAAMWCSWWARRGVLEAAIEIDRRFDLRERVSSSLTLNSQERETEAGRALIGDANRRVQRLDVGSGFRIRPTWRLLLPLLPAVAILVLVLWVPNAVQAKSDRDGPQPVDLKKQIENSLEGIKPKISDRKKKADELGLKDASDLFDRLEQGIDEMSKKKRIERKDVAIKLNDLSKELKQRRQDLGGTDEIKKQLNKLGDLKKGPADKVADALKDGDFGKALEELNDLKEKFEQGDLTDEEKQQLADQMNQVGDQLQEMIDAHREARKQLEQQIRQQQAQGNMDEVAKLQNQLDQLNQQCPQMDQMQQLADKMGQCAQCLQEGNLQDAMAQLDQMAGALEDLQRELDEIEMLDDMLQQLADAKDAMHCQQCQGKGCKACQGQGMGGQGDKDGPPGPGLGEGQGAGPRPENDEGNEKFYDSPVPIPPGPGAAVMVGRVHGPNRAGQAREAIKVEIESARRESARAMSAPKLPRAQREHARQYFDVFREGEK